MAPSRPADLFWPLVNRLMWAHTVAYRASGGLIGHRVPGVPPMLLLDHVGAKSGTARTSALAYLRDGDDVVIVASKGGHPRNPAWFHNLRANPDALIQIGSKRLSVRARVANPAERARLWPKVIDLYGGYRDYQRRTSREIPVVILEPAEPPAGAAP
jgi:deazaflavin-dependent oxidoreductase (nitroreductase family)